MHSTTAALAKGSIFEARYEILGELGAGSFDQEAGLQDVSCKDPARAGIQALER